jgi:DNA-binding response OmpR family regulator
MTEGTSFLGKTVLVIDRERLACQIARCRLEQSGFNVLTTTSAIDGIGTLSKYRSAIDVVIVDSELNGASDLGLVGVIRAISSDAKVILATDAGETVTPGTRFGVSGLVQRPFLGSQLLESVAASLLRRDSQDAGDGSKEEPPDDQR